MTKFAKILLPFLALVFCGVVMNLTTATPAVATANLPVTVTNTPLPVQGTVSLGNTAEVNVANTPNVNIANTTLPVSGSVSVENAVDSQNNAVPLVTTPQGVPYSDSCDFTANYPNDICTMKRKVPDGQRLVIQAVTFNGKVYDGFYAEAALEITTGGAPGSAYLAPSIIGIDTIGLGYRYQAAHHATTLYADPGTQPLCEAIATANTSRTFTCTISGYTVPAIAR